MSIGFDCAHGSAGDPLHNDAGIGDLVTEADTSTDRSFTDRWVENGKVGGGFEFNGEGDLLRIDTGFDSASTEWTLCLWIYPEGHNEGNHQRT